MDRVKRWPKRPTPASKRGLAQAMQQLYGEKCEADALSPDRMLAMREQIRVDAEASRLLQGNLQFGAQST